MKPPIHGGWSVTATAGFAVGDPEARPNGKKYQDLEVDAKVNESAGGGFDFRLFGGDLSFGAEREVSYEATVSEKRADRIQDGAKAPDPYHWRSLRKGESVTYTDGNADTSSGGINVGPLRFGGNTASGDARYTGIKRVGEHEVQISVGDEDFVRESNGIGFGIDEAHADAISGFEHREGEQSRVTLDMRSRRNQRALDRFLENSELPAPDGKGRSDAAVEESETWTEDASGSLTLGPVHHQRRRLRPQRDPHEHRPPGPRSARRGRLRAPVGRHQSRPGLARPPRRVAGTRAERDHGRATPTPTRSRRRSSYVG